MTLRLPRLARLSLGAVLAAAGSVSVSAAAEDPAAWQPPREASLPAGFLAPTPPGVVRVKFYGPVRGALHRSEGTLGLATWRSFWPLFRHIEERGIPMSAPVVATYPEDAAEAATGATTVAFLCPEATRGTAGEEEGGVEVRDLPGGVVVSVGVRGAYSMANLRRSLATLEAWLAENAGTWRRAGAPRALYYQQPMFFDASSLYSEVELPIRPAPLP